MNYKAFHCLSFVLLTQISLGQFEPNPVVYCNGCEFPTMLLDWDQDPGSDLMMQANDSLFFRSNDGTGNFLTPQFLAELPPNSYIDFFEDIDDDGDHDLMVRHGTNRSLLRNGSTSFTTVLIDASVDSTLTSYHPIDFGLIRSMYFDGDGLKDLIWRKQSGDSIRWYQNDGSGGYSAQVTHVPGINLSFQEIITFDQNGDGLRDLVYQDGADFVFHMNNGVQWDSTAVIVTTPRFPIASALDVQDMNGDGVMDLMSSGSWLLSDPDSTWHHYPTTAWVNYGFYRRIMDLDCDAGPEVFGRGANVGHAHFPIYSATDTTVSSFNINLDSLSLCCVEFTAGDMNGDGAADLLYKSVPFASNDSNVYVHYNLNARPQVSLVLPFMSVPFGQTVLLSGGAPAGGTYSGPGVVGDSLFTSMTGGGPVLITYTYSTTQGCSDSATATVDIATRLLNQFSGDAQFNIFPNPSNGEITITSTHPERMFVKITDAVGKLVIATVPSQADSTLKLDVQDLSKGFYTLTILSEDGTMMGARTFIVE